MTKNRILAFALMGSFALLAACGKSSNNNGAATAPVQGQAVGPNGVPLNQNTPYLVNCPANQLRLQNVCRAEANLASACANAGGSLNQQGNLCRLERRIVSRIRSRRRAIGYGVTTIPLPAFNMRNGESLRVHGQLIPYKARNDDWTLVLYQNGHRVTSTENGVGSASGPDGSGHFSMSAQPLVQSGVVQGMPSYPAQAQLNQGFYGNMQMMPQQPIYSLDVQARDGFKLEYTVTAVSCEDGRGNPYPCP